MGELDRAAGDSQQPALLGASEVNLSAAVSPGRCEQDCEITRVVCGSQEKQMADLAAESVQATQVVRLEALGEWGRAGGQVGMRLGRKLHECQRVAMRGDFYCRTGS